MARYIAADAFIESISVLGRYNGQEVINLMRHRPTADVVEVVRGKWIRDVDYDYPCICNKCGYQFAYKGAVIRCDDIFHFCPNCGADMRGDDDESN